MKQISEGMLESKLSEFLFQYRITPHPITGISPAQLLLGRTPRSRLNLLYPHVSAHVQQRQEKQKQQHDIHAKSREFQVGEGGVCQTVSVQSEGDLDSSRSV